MISHQHHSLFWRVIVAGFFLVVLPFFEPKKCVSMLVLATPQSAKVDINIQAVHYTACLLNIRADEEPNGQTQRLPVYVENPTVLKDRDGNRYHVAVFANTVAAFENGDSFSEICHAFLADNVGRLKEAVPEATFLQSSKCYGFDAPGYDYMPYEVLIQESASVGSSIKTYLNSSFVYSQTPIASLPLDPTTTIDNVVLDTFHTHHANAINSSPFPFYGYFMRVHNPYSTSMALKPVSISLGDSFNDLFSTHLDASDLHTCLSFERIGITGSEGDSNVTQPSNSIPGVTVAGHYDLQSSPQDFYASLDRQQLRDALSMDDTPIGNVNLESTIFDVFQQYLNGYATGFEFPWMPKFRTVTAVLDLLYVFLMAAQRKRSGKFPSSRFDNSKTFICIHILMGFLIIHTGVFLHFQNEINNITKAEDEATYRQVLYYVFGTVTVLHSITIYGILPKVMGEKRITIPLYFVAGTINLGNAIALLMEPTLQNAFLVWGSVNTFVYVRFSIFVLSFSHLDWELVYTYSVLVAAAITYPLTGQDIRIFYGLAAPAVYAPFHERICAFFPMLAFTEEDFAAGNTPSKKNISEFTIALRSHFVDKNYADKVRAMRSVEDCGITEHHADGSLSPAAVLQERACIRNIAKERGSFGKELNVQDLRDDSSGGVFTQDTTEAVVYRDTDEFSV